MNVKAKTSVIGINENLSFANNWKLNRIIKKNIKLKNIPITIFLINFFFNTSKFSLYIFIRSSHLLKCSHKSFVKIELLAILSVLGIIFICSTLYTGFFIL